VNVHVVMPAFNEAEGIGEFLHELNTELQPWNPTFTVVDDCSLDNTSDVVTETAATGVSVSVVSNSINSGHGPSTIRALSAGVASGAPIILAMDGDGQFVASDVRRVLEVLADGAGTDIVEGVRSQRDDPWFRKAVSFGTQVLVWSRTGQLPADANTPLRAYRRAALEQLLGAIPENAMTPNLLVSVMSRRGAFTLTQVQVRSRPRRGASDVGTTWGRGGRLLPSSRFVTFCWNAGKQWITMPRSGTSR